MSILGLSLVGKTFARGVHPPDRKQLSAGQAIEVFPTPKTVVIPLLQHLGQVCDAAVKARTDVEMGTVIGTSEAFISAPVHSSVAGRAQREQNVTLPNGRYVPAIPIKTDEEKTPSGRELFDEIYGGEWLGEGLDSHEPDEIVQAARDAGLVGHGGAAFPTYVKLKRNEEKPVDTVLVNGCECEPYLTADHRLMIEAPEPIVAGALLARQATGAKEVLICLEDNKREAAEALRNAAQGTPARILILKTKYPQGGEKQLIDAALGREVPNGGLPGDVGAVVINVATSAALARAVLRGKPLTHRIISVSGAGIAEPKNLLVPIGVSYQEVIEHCGGLKKDAARIVAGGPMMGFTLGSLDVPVTKGTSGITAFTHDEIRKAQETHCLRCGRCVDACPMRLVPTKIALAARSGNIGLAEKYHITACMECGSCTYTCPASIPLVQLIRVGKVMLRKAQQANQN